MASDNYAGVLPEMLEALDEASRFHARSYGYNDFTEKAKQEFVKYFGNNIEVNLSVKQALYSLNQSH